MPNMICFDFVIYPYLLKAQVIKKMIDMKTREWKSYKHYVLEWWLDKEQKENDNIEIPKHSETMYIPKAIYTFFVKLLINIIIAIKKNWNWNFIQLDLFTSCKSIKKTQLLTFS